LRAEVITLAQLRDAERMWSPTCRFGKALVQRGVLSPRELWNGVKYQIEEIVRSLFAYASGTVHFWEGEVQPDNVVRLTLPTRRLIAEGLRKRDELFKLLAMLEDPNVRLRRNEDYGGNLWGNERAFVEMLEAEDAFAALCRRAGFDLLSGARTVQLLRLVGAIRITREDGPAAPASTGEVRKKGRDLVRECVINHVRLLGELAAPMVAVEGGQAVGERIASVLKETAATYPKLLEGLKVDPSGVLDPDDLLQRALRLPGDRERTVRAALGELVSYLEFELLNHPKIEEPEHFLSAIEGLRANLEL
jgi:hypothetical protein